MFLVFTNFILSTLSWHTQGSSALPVMSGEALRAAWPSPAFYRQEIETIWKAPRPEIVIWVWEREDKIEEAMLRRKKPRKDAKTWLQAPGSPLEAVSSKELLSLLTWLSVLGQCPVVIHADARGCQNKAAFSLSVFVSFCRSLSFRVFIQNTVRGVTSPSRVDFWGRESLSATLGPPFSYSPEALSPSLPRT